LEGVEVGGMATSGAGLRVILGILGILALGRRAVVIAAAGHE
jgi:hypothetical protein